MPPRPPRDFLNRLRRRRREVLLKATCKAAVLTQHICHARSIPVAFEEAIMLNPTSLLADALGRNLAETYRRIFGDREPHFASGLDEAARLVIERIGSSDALYHDCQHTALVTLCVQDILRGRRLERVVTPDDWAHTIIAGADPRYRICARRVRGRHGRAFRHR
jgi:hypothetical protein